MRTLHADLTAAIDDPSSQPYVAASITNKLGPVRRLDFTTLDTTGYAVGDHDVAVCDGGQLVRIRADGADVKHQTIANPAVGPYATWTTIANRGDFVACAAMGARAIIVYTDTPNTQIYYKESTDSGATWGAETSLVAGLASAVNSLSVTYKPNTTNDLAITWTRSAAVHELKKRTAGLFSATIADPNAFATLNGVAITHNGLDYDMMLTGTETVSLKPTLWTEIYGDGGLRAVGTWSVPFVQVQADVAALTTFQQPSLVFNGQFRATFVDVPGYTGGTTRTYRTWLHPFADFDRGDYTWRAPTPVNNALTEGIAIDENSTAGYAYESSTGDLKRASLTPVTLDVSGDLVAFDVEEDTADAGGFLELDNTSGQYAGPPAPIQLGNLVQLDVGFYTASGNRTSGLLDLFIAGWEYRRDGGVSRLRLRLESGWHQLRRARQRTQVLSTAYNYLDIASRIFLRAGMLLNTSGSSARASAITPAAFTIHPWSDGYAALRSVLDFIADRCFMTDDAQGRITEPLAADTTNFTIAATHPVYELVLAGEAAPVAETIALRGDGAAAWSTDYALAEYGLGTTRHMRDVSAASGTALRNTATAQLRQRKLDERNGRIIMQPHVGLEVLDMVDISDSMVSGAAVLRRVMAIRWRFQREPSALRRIAGGRARSRPAFEQTLELGPP
jgi:hypothetical protein